ncbi:MAG: ASKHA domain-containing protein [Desulfobulbaceae bacterium]|nr:ASKHA domain-containing protein [Desulfobulbaceae bacterium]
MPIVLCLPIKASPPSLQDNSADLDRLKKVACESLGNIPLVIPWRQAGQVARNFRQAGFQGAALINQVEGRSELIDFLPCLPAVLPAMALDLGTTYLEASLIDLLSGKRLAQAHHPNGQIPFGDDVLSRIHVADRGTGLSDLQKAVIASINELSLLLADQAKVEPHHIRAMSVSGNPTMVHLFLGLDPHHMCREPYIPLVNAPDTAQAFELGLAINPAAPVYLLPGVGSYFGGDLISGILASGLDQQEETSMLIDVGTNAEVVLGNRDWLIACAGAAGPALEGGVARMGMRAGPGAIEHISINPKSREVAWQTIEHLPACGLCGSGIIDLVAGLYLAGIIDRRGKFRPGSDPARLIDTEGGFQYVVVAESQAAAGRAVVLEQVDLDALMRSKAAMYAILSTLLSQVGIAFSDLHRIYVAGAFGRHIAPRQAITLGMLPDLPLTVYQPIGNSSLSGAEKVLLEDEARQRCRQIMQKITYIELNVNQEFMLRFSGSKFIPHTNHSLFPSVPVFDW